jgi:orotidine-5'-phosphate decarboxylase
VGFSFFALLRYSINIACLLVDYLNLDFMTIDDALAAQPPQTRCDASFDLAVSDSAESLRQRIIVPLDVPNLNAAIELIDRLPDVTFWKVGLELFVSTGAQIIQVLKEREKRVFLDLKFHDIPNTVAGACRSAAGYGVDLLTVHATVGKPALTAAMVAVAEGAAGAGVKPPQVIAITLLTSLNSRELAFDLHIPLELPEYALKMALLAQDSGLNGVVCSPHEVADLRRSCRSGFIFVCPGVRPKWATKGDQQRTLTPSQAITAGADYLVIGRPITAAPDPRSAWQRIISEE